ncbi:hypothetical protein Tco_0841700 [Tanacetum coccineum]|uniref:Uncharacterized protein n=1 Tax=Tanacetum coccineum TaxID=301880 RepID=A0ABQ5AYF8_9ASTR
MNQTPRKIKRGQDTKIPQSSGPPKKVGDEAVYKELGDRMERAATTASSLEAEQDSGNINRTQSMATLNEPINTLGSGEDSMKLMKLMEHCTKLSELASIEDIQVNQDSDGINILPTTEIFEQLALMGMIFIMMHRLRGAKVYDLEINFGGLLAPEEVYTAEPDISTANVPVSTASAETKTKIQQEQERLGFKEAQRLQQQFDKKERQRIISVHEESNTFKPEEWDNIQAQIEADEELAHRLQAQERERYSEADNAKLLVELINERKRQFSQQRAQQRRNRPLTQAQQRSYMCNYIKHMGSHTLQQLRGYSFDEIKILFEAIVKRVNTFTPMESDDTVLKVVAGSSKRSAEEELGEESSKRQNIGEGSKPAEESKDKESDELSQEQLQQLIIIVPEEGMNVEALQTKYQIIDWEDLVRERFSSTEPTDDKERALWVELKRLFEPDTDDLLKL